MQVQGILRVQNQSTLCSERIPELSLRLKGQTRIRIKTNYVAPIEQSLSLSSSQSPATPTDEPDEGDSDDNDNEDNAETEANRAQESKKRFSFGWKFKWSSRKLIKVKNESLIKKRCILLDEPAIVFYGPGAEPGSLLLLKPGERK